MEESILSDLANKWWDSLGNVDKKLTYTEQIYYSPLQERPDKPSQKQIVRMYKILHNISLS